MTHERRQDLADLNRGELAGPRAAFDQMLAVAYPAAPRGVEQPSWPKHIPPFPPSSLPDAGSSTCPRCNGSGDDPNGGTCVMCHGHKTV